MKQKILYFLYNDKEYVIHGTARPFQRGYYARFRNGEFFVSTNSFMSEKEIIKLTAKFAPRLLVDEVKSFSLEKKWCYLFGEKITINFNDVNELNYYLKLELLGYLDNRVREYEKIMNIANPYKINVRNTKTRYGSNSWKTHSLSFQLDLVHFSREIIDSVIVHELAHDKHHNHQKEFYNEVYKYCPNYWDLKKKLRKRNFK